MPYFHKWKLQPAKIPTPQEQWECTKQVLFSHFTIQLPTVSLHDMLIQDAYFMKIWLFHPLAESFGMATWQVPFPSWKAIVPQILFFFFFEDLFHFLGMCLSLKYL